MAFIKNILQGFLGLKKDPNATTQDTAVIKAEDTNSGIAIVPNGTGAITAQVPDGTVAGGNARGTYSVDLQRVRNNANQVAGSGEYAVIVGGQNNRNVGPWGFLGGGRDNAIAVGGAGSSWNTNTIVGGSFNTIFNLSRYAFIGAGSSNSINSGAYGTISGGASNTVSSAYSTISGGQSNTASTGTYATVVGGYLNLSSGTYSVSGGYSSEATGEAAIGIGRHAHARNTWAVAFGNNNTVNNLGSSILGGDSNNISSNFSVVSGGQSNTASTGTHATVVGGYQNSSTGQYSISGGYSNVASGQGAVALGYDNTASGNFSTAFGYQSIASGRTSFVVGDTGTKATSDYSVAFGERVSSNNVCEISQGARIQVDYDTSHHLAMLKADLSTQASAATGNIGSYNMSKAAYAAGAASYKFNVDYQIFIIGTSGTTTGVAKGDVFARSESFIATTGTWGGTAPSYPGITTPSVISTDTVGAITGAEVTYSLSGNNLVMDYVMPTFTGGGTVNARIFVSFKAINLTKYM